MPTLPPVLLLGIDTPIGLSLVRELGQRGVAVHGIARSRRGVGLFSRHLASGTLHPGRDEALLELLRRLSRQHGIPFLMAVSEPDLLFLNAHREALPGLRLLLPPPKALALALDKSRTLELAAGLGLATPATVQPTHPEEAEAIAARLAFPLVLKWADPQEIAPLLASRGLPLRKAEFAHDPASLRAILERTAILGRYPLVQSWVPGYGLGQSFFMHRGRSLLFFQHRRLHEWPPEGGYATLCESLPATDHGGLRRQSETLLRAMGWEGAAMVEYRLDPERDTGVLMEVNGRFWGSLPLARQAGAPFGWTTYQVLGLEQEPELDAYTAGVRCRYAIPELRRLAALFFRAGAIPDPAFRPHPWRDAWSFVGESFSRRLTHYVWDGDDPAPMIQDLRLALLSRLPGLGRRS